MAKLSWSPDGRADAYVTIQEGLGVSESLLVTIDASRPNACRAARVATRELFDGTTSPTHRDDVALVAHELVANAIGHGADPVRLLVKVQPEETLVAVFDAGDRMPTSDQHVPGHGLHLVDVLTGGDWGVDVIEGGKWVWAAMH